jgi:2-methylisocitrate lyase-like PEP mutase family enzyme
VSKPEEIRALVDAIRPKPFNLLVVRDIGIDVAGIAELGVRRISVGGAFALSAWQGFMRAAKALKEEGSFAPLADIAPYPQVNGLFAAAFEARSKRGK